MAGVQKYVVGFLFSDDKQKVVLIQKNRPQWQFNKLNGIGGHIELNELSIFAMDREFREETEVKIYKWQHFISITDQKVWKVDFYRSFSPVSILQECKTTTDEFVGIYDVNNLPNNVIENLRWLIPLALSNDNGIPLFVIENFVVN